MNHLEQWRDFRSPQVKNIIVEKVEVQIDFLKTQDSRDQLFVALLDQMFHKVF